MRKSDEHLKELGDHRNGVKDSEYNTHNRDSYRGGEHKTGGFAKLKSQLRKQTTKLGLTTSSSASSVRSALEADDENTPSIHSTPSEDDDLASSQDSKDEVAEEFEDANDIMFFRSSITGKMPVVKAGTVEQLIERLIPEKYPGNQLN